MRIHKLSSLIGSVASATALSAQSGPSCPNGPGSAFGIVAYQCASCGFKQEPGQAASYTFFAEPVVTQVDRSAGFASTRPLIIIDGVVQGIAAVGDVIEAVDGHPITTQAGADLFAYPTPGSHSLTVRRGRERQVLDVSVPASCDARPRGMRGTSRLGGFRARGDSLRYLGDTVYVRGDSVYRGAGAGSGAGVGAGVGAGAALAATVAATIDGIRRGSGAGAGYGRGVPVIGGDPIDVANGATMGGGNASSPAVGKFGFAVECRPSCALKRTPSGEYYYKYDGFPRIIEVREHSAADRAGLQVGDLVTKVDGRSILDDDALRGIDQRDQLRIAVRRNGKDIDAVMLVVR